MGNSPMYCAASTGSLTVDVERVKAYIHHLDDQEMNLL